MAGDEGDWGPGITWIVSVLIVLVIFICILRVYTRIWIVGSFWWDDFTIILAVLGTTIGTALCFVEVSYGFGKHLQFLTSYQKREFLKFTYGEWIQTFATLMWTKVSVCLFLMRIPASKTVLLPLQCAVIFLLFSNTVLTVIWIMQCQPLHAAWYGEGMCMSRNVKEAVILTQAVISIVSDFSFAAFPILLLWRLQIDFKTKVGLWILMGLGFITGACCIVRTVLNGQSVPDDYSYGGIVNWVWRTFEVTIGIIAACIPTLRPLYTKIMGRKRGISAPRFIHPPLPEKSKPRWSEYVRSPSPAASSRGRRMVQEDAMRKELIREGIVDPRGRMQDQFHYPFTGQRNSEVALGVEMDKYGVHQV